MDTEEPGLAFTAALRRPSPILVLAAALVVLSALANGTAAFHEPVHDMATSANGLTVLGADAGDFLGYEESLASGDINGDGTDDLIVGIPYADGIGNAKSAAGEVHVFYGSATLGGTVDLASGSPSVRVIGIDAGDQLGVGVAAGDFNSDGFDDLLLGAPEAAGIGNAKPSAGEAYVIFGDNTLASTIDLASTAPAITVIGADAGDELGWSVAAGDVTGTARDDLILGALRADAVGNAKSLAGEAFVIAGAGGLSGTVDLAATAPTLRVIGGDAGDFLGGSVAAGNFNGGTKEDVVIGAYLAGAAGNAKPEAGEAYVVFGDNGLSGTIDLATTSPGVTIFGADTVDRLGNPVATAEMNGDSFVDLLIPAEFANGVGNARPNAGEVYVIRGSATPPATIDMASASHFTVVGVDIADLSGSSVRAGDFNGDGNQDLLVGAVLADGPGNARVDAGEAYVVEGPIPATGTVDLAVTAPALTVFGADAGDYLGHSVATGNFNGYGSDDVVVAASQADGPGNARPNGGEAYAIFGDIVVDTTADTNMMACTAAEDDCTLRGAINRAVANPGAEVISFDPDAGNFPPGTPATISLGSALPSLSAGNDSIDGSGGGVRVNGLTDTFVCFNLNSNGNAIKGIELITNCSTGIVITGANNTIGGADAADRNVVSGNGPDPGGNGDGIEINGASAIGNVVRGNYIGTNEAGTAALANDVGGIRIGGGANNNTVGGNAAGDRNVISGNAYGVIIEGSGTTGNVVLGNYVGADFSGTLDVGNTSDGVVVVGPANSNAIGGAGAGSRNVISGNNADGVSILASGASSNTVKGNYIGINVAGAALGNGVAGVSIEFGAAGNAIGGSSSTERNVISGNIGNGVTIVGTGSTGNSVTGNYIGTNPAGAVAVGNGGAGVYTETPSNTVGGLTATPGTGLGNVVSGNNSGIVIKFDTADGTVVQGNLVGTNAAGTADVGNLDVGVYLTFGPDSTTIGGTAVGARNVISGNNSLGIAMFEDVTGTLVKGNYIGTDITGQLPIGNAHGIVLANGPAGNTIGGSTAAAGNVIAANTGDGIQIGAFGSAVTATTVRGNYIGVASDGTIGLGNGASGVLVQAGSTGNTIGGTAAGDGNVIALNSGDGVRVDGSGTTGNIIRRNSIHGNGLLGIENISGGNTNLAVPVITSLSVDTSIISGTTCSGCTVEVFSDGVDEGRVFQGVAVTTVTDWTFTGTLGGPQLTATATNGSGNTSEFSSPVPLVTLGAGSGDTAPGTGGGTFGTAFDLGVNDGGQAVFHNTVNGSTVTEGIFAFFAASPATAVAVQDQTTPIGGTYNTFGPPVNNNAGTVVSKATVASGSATEGLFAFFAASTEPLAWQGSPEPAPGSGTFATFSSPAVNNLNQVAATATLVGGQQGLYAFFAASPTPDKQLAIQGASAPGGGNFTGFGDPSINDQGQVAARATLSGSSEGLYAFFAAATPTELIAKKGDSAPDTGPNGKFNGFGNPSINNSGTRGRVAARATIIDGTASEGIFAFFGASPIQKLALQGETAPGTGGATYVAFGDPVINDLGQVVVKATLTGGPIGAPTEGIFAFFAASPSQELVLEGVLAAEGGTYTNFLYIAYNDVAQIVFVANVNGGPSAQGVFFASLDLDRDGYVDFQDNCLAVFNPDQHNTDQALAAAGANIVSDALGNACDTNDDNDDFSDFLETYAGTNPLDNCAGGPGTGGDAWPADFNSDSSVTGSDLSAIAGEIGKFVPPAVPRRNLAPDPPDTAITAADLSAVAGVIGKTCN